MNRQLTGVWLLGVVSVSAAVLAGCGGVDYRYSGYDIPKLSGILIDGRDDDWAGRGFRVDVLCGPDGQAPAVDDLDARFRLGWHEQGLLLFLTVRDDQADEHESVDQLWRKDSVELYVSDGVGSANRYQIVLASGADKRFGTLRRKLFERRPAVMNPPKLTPALVAVPGEGGYVVEAMLPWRDLRMSPAMGKTIGLQIHVNDTDGGERKQVMWYPSGNARNEPEAAHPLRLSRWPGPPQPAIARTHADVARGRATVKVLAWPAMVGRVGGIVDGQRALDGASFTAQGGRAAATLHMPLRRGRDPIKPVVLLPGSILPLRLGDLAKARARAAIDLNLIFEPYCFEGKTLPACDFEHPLQAENLLGPYTIRTTYYDRRWREVTEAAEPGRYGAVVEIHPASGTVLRRFRTLFRMPEGVWWWRADVDATIDLPKQLGVDPAVLVEEKRAVAEYLKWRFSEGCSRDGASAVLLAGLHEVEAGKRKRIHTGNDVWAADRQWWVKMKQKLYDTEKPAAFVCPRPIEGTPAPVIRRGTAAEAGMKPDAAATIDAVCKDWAADSDQAFAVCVVRRGVVVLHKAYGTRDGKPMTTRTKSWMASITKLLSGTLMMMLVDQGRVDLDDSVDKHLPAFRDIEVDRVMTVRNLYTHTNGLWGHWGDDMHDFEEIVAAYYPHLQIGVRHAYNGAGYGLGGKIIEMRTGEAIPKFYRKHLLGPLQCANTDVNDTYGGAMSVPMDIAKIGQMLLNRGAYGEHRFFSDATFEKMMPAPLVGLQSGPKTWGIGVRWTSNEGNPRPTDVLSAKAFGHGAASSATLAIDPVHDLVIVMTRNAAGKNFAKHNPKFIRAVVEGILPKEKTVTPGSP